MRDAWWDSQHNWAGFLPIENTISAEHVGILALEAHVHGFGGFGQYSLHGKYYGD